MPTKVKTEYKARRVYLAYNSYTWCKDTDQIKAINHVTGKDRHPSPMTSYPSDGFHLQGVVEYYTHSPAGEADGVCFGSDILPCIAPAFKGVTWGLKVIALWDEEKKLAFPYHDTRFNYGEFINSCHHEFEDIDYPVHDGCWKCPAYKARVRCWICAFTTCGEDDCNSSSIPLVKEELSSAICEKCSFGVLLINGEGHCFACKHKYPNCGDCLYCFTARLYPEWERINNGICDTCLVDLSSCGHAPACDCCEECSDPCWLARCLGCGEWNPTHLEWEEYNPDSVVEGNEIGKKAYYQNNGVRV